MTFPVLLARGGDALDGVSALLTWRELRDISVSCHAAFTSRLRLLFLKRTLVVLPPSAATCDALFVNAFNVTRGNESSVIRCLTIAHTALFKSLAARSCAWLAAVKQVTISPNRVALPPGLRTASIDVALLAVVLPSLQELSLANVLDFVDTTPLAQLERLRRLDLSATGVQDLTPLTSLHHLEFLDVSSTKVTTLVPLQQLCKLQTIALDADSALYTLVPLVACPNAPALRVKSVRDRDRGDIERLENDLLEVAPLIVDFACRGFACQWRSSDNGYEGRSTLLSAMQNVESLVIVSSKLMYRLDTLQTLTKLRVLHLSTLHSSDISAFATLQALEEVALTSDKCVDLSPLAMLPQLRSLYCHGGDPDSMMDDVGAAHKIQLSRLKILDVSNHYLERLYRLDRLDILAVYVWSGDSLRLPRGCAKSLTRLRLNGDVGLREIHDRFPRLRSLELQQCASFDAQDLPLFANLESLSLLDPHSSAVLPHQQMPQLRRLRLRGPNIKRVSESMLESIPNLQELDLEKANVENISAVVVLLKLQLINLKDTPVRDVTPLLQVPSLVTAILPKRARCTPLVNAYHDATVVSELREVLHPIKNCLWGSHWRQRQRKADHICCFNRSDVVSASSSASPVSEVTESLDRCSVA